MLTNKKLVASCSVLTLTALSLVAFSGCTPPGPRAVLDGARLLGEGHPDQAVPRLQEAVQLLPRNAQAWNYLGLAYHKVARPADAARAYQQALLLNRNLSAARFNLGCLYLDQTNTAGAIAELTTFTALQPNSAMGWAKLGTAQMRARQPDAAERSFIQALKLDAASADALNGLGLIMTQRRRYAEALNYFNSALKAQSSYAPALLNAAIVSHQNLNNRPAALQRYREYLAVIPPPPNSGLVREMADRLELELRPPARIPATNTSPAVVAAPSRADTAPLTAKVQPPSSTNKLIEPAQAQTTSAPPTSASVARADLTVTSAPPARVTPTNPVSPLQQPLVSTPPPKGVDVVQVPREEPIQPVRDSQPVLSNRTATAEADTTKTVSSPPPPTTLTSAKPATNALSPPAQKPKQSQGLIKKLNPVNWFRSKDGSEKTATRSPEGVSSDPIPPGSDEGPKSPANAQSGRGTVTCRGGLRGATLCLSHVDSPRCRGSLESRATACRRGQRPGTESTKGCNLSLSRGGDRGPVLF